jgi:HSP20 family molecular chaperone IbpA
MTTSNAMTGTNGPARKACCSEENLTSMVQRSQQKEGTVTYRPRLNMFDFSNRYELYVELPGSSSELIHATIDEGVLTVAAAVPDRHAATSTSIRAEYGVGDYHTKIRLGEDVDAQRLTAKYERGVLTLVLPKLPERQPRRVPIQNG